MGSINVFVAYASYLYMIALLDFSLQHFYSGSCQQEMTISGFFDMFLILEERSEWIVIYLGIFKTNQPHDNIIFTYAVMPAH